MFWGPLVRHVSFCMSADVDTKNSMASPAVSSSRGGIDSDQICQNSNTLLSSSRRKLTTPLASDSLTRGDMSDVATMGDCLLTLLLVVGLVEVVVLLLGALVDV